MAQPWKNEFNGTAQIVYQQSSTNIVSEKLLIDRNQNRSLNYDPFPASLVCPKPKPKNEIYSQFTPKNKNIDWYRKWDCIGFWTKTLKHQNSTNVTQHGQLITHLSLRSYQPQLTVVAHFILPRPPIGATFIQFLNCVGIFQQLDVLVEKQLFL